MDRQKVMRRLLSRRTFSETIARGVNSPCWLYGGAKNGDGYGVIAYNGKAVYSHRLAAFLWNGFDIDCKLLVRHKCQNRKACFNPKHLTDGTSLDNVADMIAAGSYRTSALTNADVRSLIFSVRSGKSSIAAWAIKKGVAYATAYRAFVGVTHTELVERFNRSLDVMFDIVPDVKHTDLKSSRVIRRLPERDRDYIAVMAEINSIPF